ncbi:uncharacterized protein LOC134821825 [Bolinopsis microptera]|uniref:uncharacterized protein LOC134821825 n=1 Tax=Bolinopsis microptera TaxID=2820187 RepID=UPI00307A00FE
MGTVRLLLVVIAIQLVGGQEGGKALDGLDEAQKHIINGQDADKNEYPFMVRIKADGIDHLCGGSLISTTVVLTAAHCVTMEDGSVVPAQMGVLVMGDHTNSTEEAEEKSYRAVRIIVHEEYHLDFTGIPIHDLALIVLSTEVDINAGIIDIIPVAEKPYVEGSAVTVIGWGVDSDDDADRDEWGYHPAAETLQELEYVIGNQAECKQYWKDLYEGFYAMFENLEVMNMDTITETMVCAIDDEGLATVWSGDSGGPLFQEVDGTITQIGVVSWGHDDIKEITHNMYVNLYHYADWIKEAMKRAEEKSWVELHTGGSHGVVMMINLSQDGDKEFTTVCNDNVGANEVNAICRGQGYQFGALANIRDYVSGGKRQRSEMGGFPPFGHINMKCNDEAEDVMTDCAMDKYEDSEVPCFNGQQLAVKCADEKWDFNIVAVLPVMRSIRGSSYVRGRVSCMVNAQKDGVDLDMKSQVKVGLVMRNEDAVEPIGSPMKYRRSSNIYVGKFRTDNEIKTDDCLACIAYIPGHNIYTVGTVGPDDCPDDDEHYKTWVKLQNEGEGEQ